MAVARATPPFEREEYMLRLARTKQEMEARGLAALVLTQAANIVYLTGYTGQSAYVPQAAIVAHGLGEPLLIVRRMDAPGAVHTSFMQAENVVGYPEALIGLAERSGYDFIAERMMDLGLAGGAIGFELGSLPVASAEVFRKQLPAARMVDATDLVTWIRLVKSDREVELIREAAIICDGAIARALEVIRPGLRECEAAGEIAAALCRGTERFGGHSIVPPLMPAGPRIGTSHLTWTEEPIQRGRSINIEVGAFRYRYAAAIMRTVCVGAPSDRLRRLHEATLEGMRAAFETIRPGALCEDVAAAFGTATRRRGFLKESRCGYPIGIDWLEPSASLRAGDRTELKPNMTFHLMLGMWVEDDFGYVLSETFRVTPNGAESFASTPRELFIVQ